jgi:hypothetical protein
MWPWLMPAYVRLIGPTICVPAILAAVALDHAQGRSRDWLHFGGIAAILALALTDLVIHVLLVLSV